MESPSQRRFPSRLRPWFRQPLEDLDSTAQRVLAEADQRRVVASEPNARMDRQSTFGERMADRVARFGGSWTFILIFASFLFGWALLNTEVLGKTAFDPYPYIFLNLVLSMLAAVQAPIIMMSQNRQSAKDRQMASIDYEVNLKAEVEIMALHEKLDALRGEQIVALIEQQQRQIDLLTRLLETPQERRGL